MTTLTIRPATSADQAAVRRLAALDSAPVPTGDLLLGLVDDQPVAAVAVATGAAVADPFVPTADVVELLRTRAERLRPQPSATPRRRRLRSLLYA